MSSVQAIGVWAVSACAVGAILIRPRGIPEWIWAVAGAVLVALIGGMNAGATGAAIARGADVYAFLIGIVVLAELGRAGGVFDALARALLRTAGASRARLFALVYGAGIVVTALLSNDTTVIVLTPAVLAALARTDAQPLPYLYACAFVANAASFLLPISNPANLVLFGGGLPALVPWLAVFGVPAAAAIVLTYAMIHTGCRDALRGTFRIKDGDVPSQPSVRRIAGLLLAAAAALVFAAAAGWNVGYVALAAAAVALLPAALANRETAVEALRHTQWSIIPLVAGLFVIVTALDRSGAIDVLRALLVACESLGAAGRLLAGVAVTLAANIFNNLPVGLAAGVAIQSSHFQPHVVDATLVAVDLGPNLSVTGSLATLLWLAVLRRDGIEVAPLQFLRIGALVLVPALVAALLLVR